jgi:hypothetical protein
MFPLKGFKQRQDGIVWLSICTTSFRKKEENGLKWDRNIVVEQRPESQGRQMVLSKKIKIIEK